MSSPVGRPRAHPSAWRRFGDRCAGLACALALVAICGANRAFATVPPEGPADGDPRVAFAGEPTVLALQRAAVRVAQLEPERIEKWQRRARVAALAPTLRVRLGRGTGQLQTTSELDGTTRLTLGDRDAWQFEVAASWNLDRLVWNPDELRLAREAQHMSAHRERLLAQIAAVYAERRRLQTVLLVNPPREPLEVMEARLKLDELTAILDGLTGGALSRALRSPGAPRSIAAPPTPAGPQRDADPVIPP